MAPPFEPLQRGSTIIYGVCAGIWVMILFAPPVLADLKLARPSLLAMRTRRPGGFATLTWVTPAAGFSMDSESRALSAKITDEFSASIRAQATLIEGTGFQAAAVRAIISGIDLMTRSSAPKKVFSELRPCVEWCVQVHAQEGQPAAPPAQITEALAALRETLG